MGRITWEKFLSNRYNHLEGYWKDYGEKDIRKINISDFVHYLESKGVDRDTQQEAFLRGFYFQHHANMNGTLDWGGMMGYNEKEFGVFATNYQQYFNERHPKSLPTKNTTNAGTTEDRKRKQPDTTEFTTANKVQKTEPTIDPREQKRKFDVARIAARNLNLMADVEMGGGGGDGGADGGNSLNKPQVTPVSRFPYAFEGIPRQYTTILPYWKTVTNGAVSATAGSRSTDMYIRMNSIYDILKEDGIGFTADPTAIADIADAGAKETPMWRAYWGQFWEWWTVVECRYKIDIQLTSNRPDVQMGIIWGYVGLQKPPKVSSGTTDITYDEYRRWKGYNIAVTKGERRTNGVIANQTADGGGSSADPITSWTENFVNGKNIYHGDGRSLSIKGVYHPGDGTHEVTEDELAERWIYGNNVPKEQNLLWIRTFYMPTSAVNVELSYTYRVDVEYVVQYKDQKVIWQFPHSGVTSVATSLALT